MKKGLRHFLIRVIAAILCRERFPDEEGIKTAPSPCLALTARRERFPDEEGIKTGRACTCLISTSREIP